MIFMDYKPFAKNNDFSDGLNEIHKFSKARAENAIFDEIHMQESVDIVSNPTKEEWGFDTVFLWDCESVEAGNVGLGGMPINQLILRRRRKEDFIFENIHSFDFNSELQFYEFEDRFVESYEDYVYGIQPMAGTIGSGVLGETTTQEVEVNFAGVWIMGKDSQYKLMFNLEVGDYETVIPTETVETMGSAFPTVMSSGNVHYRKGNLTCMLVSDQTVVSGKTNPKEEKKLRKAIMAFLTDRKPKIFKDGSGETMLISIVGTPTLQPMNELNQLIYNISLEFVEVGDTSVESLRNSGLVVG